MWIRFRAWFTRQPLWQRVGMIVLAVAFVTAPFRSNQVPAPAPTPSPPPPLAAAPTPAPSPTGYPADLVATCREGLADLQRTGLVRSVTADQVEVEDALWAASPARDKQTLLRSVSCALRGRPLLPGERTRATGYRSGKELAVDSPLWGVTFN